MSDNKNQLENFRLRMEELKEAGVDVDPQKLTEDIIQSHMDILEGLTEEEKSDKLFNLAKEKVISLLNDYKEFYKPKGRKLKIAIEIVKENSADKYGEKFIYSDDIHVVSVIGIGTKGKYEKTIEEK